MGRVCLDGVIQWLSLVLLSFTLSCFPASLINQIDKQKNSVIENIGDKFDTFQNLFKLEKFMPDKSIT